MGNFRFIRRKRIRFVNFMSNSIWIAFIFTTFLLFMIVVVCYEGDDAADDVTVIRNRQILEEKQGLRSREEELLELAAELEKELFEYQERIRGRLEILNARKTGLDGGRELDSTRHHHQHQHDHGGGEGTEHRLKRRLMDARSSHGLGEVHGPFVGQSSSSAIETTTQDDQSIPGVKAGKSNKTGGILRNTLETEKAGVAVDPPGANLSLGKPHNANKLRAYNTMEINNHQSIMKARLLESLHESRKLNNQTKRGSIKHLKKLRNSTQNALNHQSLDDFKNGLRYSLSESGVISTNDAATTTLAQPFSEPEDHRDDAVMVLDEPLLGCEDLAHVNSREQVGSGYTKRVERVELRDGRWVAVKSVWTEGHDVTTCLKRGVMKRDCVQLANYKLMKEIALLQQLRHPNIIKVRPTYHTQGRC